MTDFDVVILAFCVWLRHGYGAGPSEATGRAHLDWVEATGRDFGRVRLILEECKLDADVGGSGFQSMSISEVSLAC